MTPALGIAPVAHLSPRWRAAWVGALGLAVALHGAFFLSLLISQILALLGLGPAPQRRPKPKRDRQFILVETQEDEPVEDARMVGAASRQARDRFRLERPEDAPHSEGKRPVPHQRIGRRTPSRPKPPQRPSRPRRRTARQTRQSPQRRESPNRAEQPDRPKTPGPTPSPRPTRKATQQAPPRPSAQAIAEARRSAYFKPVAPAPEGGAAPNRKRSSARLEGDRSYRLLKAKYPEYMAIVKKRFGQGLYAAGSMRERSYRTGEVVMRFGIAPDGTLSKAELVERRSEMLAEETLCRDALEAAAPFPPFTEEMKKDAKLFDNIGVRVFF
jgi:outer membrane biosynthesis protein TonB